MEVRGGNAAAAAVTAVTAVTADAADAGSDATDAAAADAAAAGDDDDDDAAAAADHSVGKFKAQNCFGWGEKPIFVLCDAVDIVDVVQKLSST